MVKNSVPRHSKSKRDPVTLDLEAEAADDETRGEKDSKQNASPDAGSVGAAAESSTEDAGIADGENGDQEAGADTDSETQPAMASGTSGGFKSVLAGGAGGLAALALAAGLQWGGALPNLGAGSDTSALEQEIAALKSGYSELSGAVASLPASPPAVDLSVVEQRISDLEGRTELLAPSDGSAADPTEISASLGQLRDVLEANSQQLAEFENRLGEIETTLAVATASSTGDQSELMTSLRGELDALAAKLDEAQTQIGAMETATAGQIADLQAQVTAPGDELKVAVAIAAAGLKTAIDRGSPFMAELEALASVEPDHPAVSGLSDLAARGVPARGQLIEQFPAVANAIIDATRPQSEDEGIFGRLISSAQSMVKVRPTGEVSGEGPEAIVARMELALANGDLTRLLGEWSNLPDEAKAVSQKYIHDVEARLLAEDLVSSALSGALAGAGSAG